MIKRLYRLGFERQQLATMFHMIDWMMRLPEPDEQRFWQDVCELEEESTMEYMTSFERLAHDKGRALGAEQGMQQGMRAGTLQVVSQMLTARFGPIPAWAQARLAAASMDELNAWCGSLLSAESLEAVFAVTAH